MNGRLLRTVGGMTKLQRKIKEQSKQRSHKKAVTKRREKRRVEFLNRRAKDLAEKEKDVNDDTVSKKQREHTGPGIPMELDLGECGDLARVSGKKTAPGSKKKQLTRKQMKRKERGRSRGEAVTDMLKTKARTKIIRVKTRARVRNADLEN